MIKMKNKCTIAALELVALTFIGVAIVLIFTNSSNYDLVYKQLIIEALMVNEGTSLLILAGLIYYNENNEKTEVK